MSADDDPDREDATRASNYDPYDEDGPGSPFSYVWPVWGGAWGLGWLSGSEDADDRDETGRDETRTRSNGSWWDEGLIGLLLVVGAVLFLFPEPGTSAIGILLLIVGILAWIGDAVTEERT